MNKLLLLRKSLAIFVLALTLIPGFAKASDDPATAVVRDFYAQLTTVMKQGNQLGFEGRCKKLDPTIHAVFNLPLMTRVAVGSSWVDASLQEQTDLISAFSTFSIANYASHFAGYDGEQFLITGEKPSGKDIIVESSLKPKSGDKVSLDYLLRVDDKGAYRIIDVFINGTISEMATRRAEFSAIARRDGISALVNSLGQKSRDMGSS